MRTKLYNCLSPKLNTDSRINSYATRLQISLTLLLEYFILALFHRKNDNSIPDSINSNGLLNSKKDLTAVVIERLLIILHLCFFFGLI